MINARNILYLDSNHSDDERRTNLYKGELYLYGNRASVMKLVQHARDMIEDAFKGRDPELAQYEMDVKEYEALLTKLKPAFVNSPEGKVIMRELLADFGCDTEQTYFDMPRMRTSTSDNYLTTGIAYAFDAHRDTWFSAPLNQINWWLPIYEVSPKNGLVFYPDYFYTHLENGSKGYNCHAWNEQTRLIARGLAEENGRKRPMPWEKINTQNEMIIIPPVGGLIQFSGTHLHASIPNHSGKTRFSIDFRTVHFGDSRDHIGAANVDNYCTGTIMRDFLHPTTYQELPQDIILSYEDGTPVVGHEDYLLVNPYKNKDVVGGTAARF